MHPLIQGVLRSSVASARRLVHSNKTLRLLLYESSSNKTYGDIRSHESMLADRVRLDAYFEAFRRVIRPGNVVVDLGAGTGILSLLASQQNPRKIYAIEQSDIIEIGKNVAQHNGISMIEFVQANSKEFTPPDMVDLIIHEQIGHYLFNEYLVENLLDLKRRVLKPEGKILPAKFELYVEPVCLKSEYRVPFIWEEHIHGIDFSFLRHSALYDKFGGESALTRARPAKTGTAPTKRRLATIKRPSWPCCTIHLIVG